MELEHLAPYLPFKLVFWIDNEFKGELTGLQNPPKDSYNPLIFVTDKNQIINRSYRQAKPILRPLSDLTKEITHNGDKFLPIDKINDYAPIGRYFGFAIEIDSLGQTGYRTPQSWLDPIIHFKFLNKLFEWHFDVFGLIEKGEAVDINTI